MFEFKRFIDNNDCINNKEKFYLFGDNLNRVGKAGQAIIRDNANAIGIPTKVFPSMTQNSFMDDNLHYKIVRKALKDAWIMHLNGSCIVVPEFRFGYGLSRIDEVAPKIANLINDFYKSIYETMDIKYYTGIGSRKTPKEIIDLMKLIAFKLEAKNYILRSGGADGADKAFESGVSTNMDIYLPWVSFNNNKSKLVVPSFVDSMKAAKENHPAWDSLSDTVKKLMLRNIYQVSGMNMSKQSDFVICWTEDGCESDKERSYKTGGTGLAISYASKLNIPIYNLKNERSLNYVLNILIGEN